MAEDPLKIYEKVDPDIRKQVESARNFAFKDGALPGKFKILIAMALDASHGATQGVKNLAQMAMKAGATKQEVAEALRVAIYVAGAGSAYTAAQAFREIF